MNYRERWFHEHGLPYQPPRLEHCPPFQCVGMIDRFVMPAAKARMREPGEDAQEEMELAE